ncbi:hypothetical protein KXJ78_05340 [Klebsiella grimontii]|nr:hypothetical protein KXJ78_05340 [Klebsiella grimontii]
MQPSIGSDDNQKMKKRKNIAPSAEMAGKQLHAIVPKKMYQMEMMTGSSLRQASTGHI